MFYYVLLSTSIITIVYLVRKLRELQWGWVQNNYSLSGKTYIITGSNTGLGYEASAILAARDATVIMACRNMKKACKAAGQIRKETSKGKLILMELDLSSFESIKSFANKILEKYSKFDCLINNAGVALTSGEKTKEGFEIHFGINHLGHFLLTNLLLKKIQENSSRIVIVTSKLCEYGHIDFDKFGQSIDVPKLNRLNKPYNNSKLANYYFASELYNREFDVHILCPGLCQTDIFRSYNIKWYYYIVLWPLVWLQLRTARQGAQNIIYCATDNENTKEKNPSNGYLVINLRQEKISVKMDENISEKLWKESCKLCNLTD